VIPITRWARTVDGAYIAYQDFGDGPVTIVVIHGWITHLEVLWEFPRVSRFMGRLGERMRVLHFDKRGTGMSDRFARPPDLETRMDDVRAVMDAADVERAALFAWGDGGPALATFFAATYPDRTLALCIDPHIQLKRTHDYPFEQTEDEFDESLSETAAEWGDPDAELASLGTNDRSYAEWLAKLFRYGATPGSMVALSRMWFDTDVRDILSTIRVPTLVLSMPETGWAGPEPAAYVAERIAGSRIASIAGGDPFEMEDPEPFVSVIETFLASVREEEAEIDRVLATVLLTDIVGSTAKIAELGDRGWRDLLERHHATVRALLARYRGRELDTAGDGFFATFDGPARGLRCALAIRDAVRPLGIEVRSGLHTGEVETIDGKVGGIAVSIGARICAQADPSEVLASRTVKDLVAGSGLGFTERGEHELRGVPGRWQVFAVTR
jgi:class 3 adenylate cyclase/pimeloyl-ACP methyl ester carboxylesterase